MAVPRQKTQEELEKEALAKAAQEEAKALRELLRGRYQNVTGGARWRREGALKGAPAVGEDALPADHTAPVMMGMPGGTVSWDSGLYDVEYDDGPARLRYLDMKKVGSGTGVFGFLSSLVPLERSYNRHGKYKVEVTADKEGNRRAQFVSHFPIPNTLYRQAAYGHRIGILVDRYARSGATDLTVSFPGLSDGKGGINDKLLNRAEAKAAELIIQQFEEAKKRGTPVALTFDKAGTFEAVLNKHKDSAGLRVRIKEINNAAQSRVAQVQCEVAVEKLDSLCGKMTPDALLTPEQQQLLQQHLDTLQRFAESKDDNEKSGLAAALKEDRTKPNKVTHDKLEALLTTIAAQTTTGSSTMREAEEALKAAQDKINPTMAADENQAQAAVNRLNAEITRLTGLTSTEADPTRLGQHKAALAQAKEDLAKQQQDLHGLQEETAAAREPLQKKQEAVARIKAMNKLAKTLPKSDALKPTPLTSGPGGGSP